MPYSLTFKEVAKFVKDKNKDPKLIENVDALLGMALVLAPAFVGMPWAPLPFTLSLLGLKGELVKAGKVLYAKLVGEEDENSIDRYRRMEAAYGLICFTAFFEAVDALFTDAGKELQLEEQRTLASGTLRKLGRREGPEFRTLGKIEPGLEEYKLYFPHPADRPEEMSERLLKFYTQMSQGFVQFLKVTDHWEKLDDVQRAYELDKTEKLPAKALEQFQAQYYDLASRYPLFSVWANLQEHERTRLQLAPRLEELLKGREELDVGLTRLGELVETLPARIRRESAGRVLSDLQTLYAENIKEPVLRDRVQPPDGAADTDNLSTDGAPLIFPSKSSAFVPQSFKAIRYTGSELLERGETWANVESRQDLEVFLYGYLSSPHSAHAPLIILGHPGSGKSLLTQMLAARLGQRLLTPVRVELRDINAEAEIANQVESQIYKDTKRQVGWADLTDHFPTPPLIIFDGYDELLQASGKVFADYPQKVQNFQLSEQQLKRGPIQTIITSRITLINKATIPDGSTVILLEPFDKARREKWISVWNDANAEYFRERSLQKFEVPDDEKIQELAEQPLLLLMLALYDSQANELKEQRGLDRTALYDNLIRRFILREKEKDTKGFMRLPPEKREEEIDEEVRRLGVVAVGMFNRRSLYIHARELDEDLKFYDLCKPVADSAGRSLSHAQLLLGSFFFVNQSKASGRAGHDAPPAGDLAYEFLHNTFGEFLTADSILRSLLEETGFVREAQKSSTFKAALERRLRGEDEFPKQWFANLMYTPLHSRNVILAMIREWIGNRLARERRGMEEFVAELDVVVTSELSRVISKNNMPAVMTGGVALPFGAGHPLLGYLAVYTLNLVLLRTLLSPGGYVFDESRFKRDGADDTAQDDKRLWDRLTHLWRSWFTQESLEALSEIINTSREGERITLTAGATTSGNYLYYSLTAISRVSSVLADDAVAGMSSLLGYDIAYDQPETLDEAAHHCREAGLDLDALLIIKRLQQLSLLAERLDRQQLVAELAQQFINKHSHKFVHLVEFLHALNHFMGSHDEFETRLQLIDKFGFGILRQPPDFLTLLIPAALETRNSKLIRALISRNTLEQPKYLDWITELPPEVAVSSLEMFAGADPSLFGMLLDEYLSNLNPDQLWREWPHAALRLFRLLRSFPEPSVRESLARIFPPRATDYKVFLMEDALEMMRALWAYGDHEAMRSFFEKYFIHGERLSWIPTDYYPLAIVFVEEIGEVGYMKYLFREYSEALSSEGGDAYGTRPLMVGLPLKSIQKFLQLAREYGLDLGEEQSQ